MITGLGDDHFRIGPAKVMVDGASSGPSAMMRQPYSHDKELKGVLHWNQEDLNAIVKKAHQAGYQMTAHAIGDKAVEMVIEAIEKAIEEFPREDCRHRIEHCTFIPEDLMEKICRLKIIPVSNPVFLCRWGASYNQYYGSRTGHLYPLKTQLERGVVTAIGSDAAACPENPMLGLYGMLVRKDQATGQTVGESENIGIMDAIRMYTYNGAYASFEEDKKGSLEPGKLADLVVLSQPILGCEPEELPDVKVDLTMIDGEIVYRR